MNRPPAPATPWTHRSVELADLLARVRLGDRASFASLYELTRSHLFAVVLRIQRDRALAEDILQEVYVNVWRAAESFDAGRSQPLTWLTSIARNRAIDSLRRDLSRPQLGSSGSGASTDEEGDGVYDNLADASSGPLDLLMQASEARALERCMAGLSALQRQSLALAFYSGLSHAEVAAQLRQPLGTVKSWVRRALLALKDCLQEAVEQDGRVPGPP